MQQPEHATLRLCNYLYKRSQQRKKQAHVVRHHSKPIEPTESPLRAYAGSLFFQLSNKKTAALLGAAVLYQ